MARTLVAQLVAVLAVGASRPVVLTPVRHVQPTQVSAVAGCYRTTLGRWSGPFPSGLTTEHIPPDQFQLDTAPLAPPFTRSGLRRVLPEMLRPRSRPFPAFWQFTGPDSIKVIWSTGFAGVSMILRFQIDTLTGTAESFYDVIGPEEPTASVVAVRIPCSRPK